MSFWCLTPLSAIFQYIMATSFDVEEAGVPGENHRPLRQATGNFITCSLRVECNLLAIYNAERTHAIIGDDAV
ncbi:MAG: hypothetical protein H0A75_02000 [Candidatus Methanofishera endochildressiae]|uniref:Uncharacterized protein n=1 Tax=Candidatus Methanofishera endochildressiae TaxID=2738884 RepID=A0A7Z0MMW2_9GAMM|nr:hypothetical protein [Candidatus Methanofishera endochildressiae]